MKSILVALFLLSTASAYGMQVDVTCFPKAYSCNGPSCGWQTIPAPVNRVLDLIQDPNYPNSQYPYEVWRARLQTQFDRHYLTLTITYSSQDMLNPLQVFANLATATVMAEASGKDHVDVALRNANYGRGFLCSNIRLVR